MWTQSALSPGARVFMSARVRSPSVLATLEVRSIDVASIISPGVVPCRYLFFLSQLRCATSLNRASLTFGKTSKGHWAHKTKVGGRLSYLYSKTERQPQVFFSVFELFGATHTLGQYGQQDRGAQPQTKSKNQKRPNPRKTGVCGGGLNQITPLTALPFFQLRLWLSYWPLKTRTRTYTCPYELELELKLELIQL